MMKRSNYNAGKANREGISLIELFDLFPDESSATDWFETVYWPEERCCGHCGIPEPRSPALPYWCSDCRKYLSVRTAKRGPFHPAKMGIAIYLD